MKLCIHYGFGDYIVCYGMVRELARREDITLYAIEHRSKLHTDNIRRLYSTITNVTISTESPDKDAVYIGWDKFTQAVSHGYKLPFANFFYHQADVPLNMLWDNFVFNRNTEKEKRVFYDMGLKDGEVYDIRHDDPFRGFVIREEYIDLQVKTIRLVDFPDISILDTLYVIEHSRRLHTFTTGLVAFVDQMNITHNNLYLHRYIRPKPYDQMILRLNWHIID